MFIRAEEARDNQEEVGSEEEAERKEAAGRYAKLHANYNKLD